MREPVHPLFSGSVGRHRVVVPPCDTVCMSIDPALLEILVCPQTHVPLREVGDWLVSTDQATRLRYPIRDGLPIMLADQAETMSETDWHAAMGSTDV